MLSKEDKQKIIDYELYMSKKKFGIIDDSWKDKIKRWCCCNRKLYSRF